MKTLAAMLLIALGAHAADKPTVVRTGPPNPKAAITPAAPSPVSAEIAAQLNDLSKDQRILSLEGQLLVLREREIRLAACTAAGIPVVAECEILQGQRGYFVRKIAAAKPPAADPPKPAEAPKK